jgi:hypothetical protein
MGLAVCGRVRAGEGAALESHTHFCFQTVVRVYRTFPKGIIASGQEQSMDRAFPSFDTNVRQLPG